MGATEALAEYIAQARYENLPHEVVNHTRDSISDTLACGLGGRKTLEGDILVDMMKEMGGRPEATVIGDRTKLPFMQAAQVNCVLTNMLDYDDTLIKLGHLSSVLIPAALAVGEHCHASGKDLINAIVLGYEAVIRLREAVEPSEEAFWKTFERVGSGMHFGVTVVAGKLLGLNDQQMADALGLTGLVRALRVTLPDVQKKGMPRWLKVTGGDIIVPGIHSVLLAKRGFPGDQGILDQGRGYQSSVGSDRYDAAKLTSSLGKEYKMLRIGYKYYPACRHISASLEAVDMLVNENSLTAEAIEQVTVMVQEWVANHFAIYEPEHMIQAQFSIPYTVSMILMGHSPGPNWYTAAMLRHPVARQLQKRVKVEGDPDLTREYYQKNKYTGTVKIQTRDGRSFSKHVASPKGDLETPFTRQDHQNKLRALASWAGLNQAQIEELIETLEKFEDLDTISKCTRLLVPQE
jgi:2-methylcitrate dehydratase PrpD